MVTPTHVRGADVGDVDNGGEVGDGGEGGGGVGHQGHVGPAGAGVQLEEARYVPAAGEQHHRQHEVLAGQGGQPGHTKYIC